MSDNTEDSESSLSLAQLMHYLSEISYFKNIFFSPDCTLYPQISCKTLPDDINSENQIPIIAISAENRPVDILFVVLINDHFKKSQTSRPKIWPD